MLGKCFGFFRLYFGPETPHFQAVLDIWQAKMVGDDKAASWVQKVLDSVPNCFFLSIVVSSRPLGMLMQLHLVYFDPFSAYWPTH